MKVITIIIITITLMLVFGLVFSEEFKPEPKGIESAKVQNAYKTYKAEVAKAQEAIFKAEAAYNASLKQAQSEAMKRGDTAEYEALKEYIAIEPPVVDKDEVKKNKLNPFDFSNISADKWNKLSGKEYRIDALDNIGTKITGLRKGATYYIVPHPDDTWRRNEFPVTKWDGAEDSASAIAYELNKEPIRKVSEAQSFVYQEGDLKVKMFSYGARSSGSIRIKIIVK